MSQSRRCTSCVQVPTRATWLPLGAFPLIEKMPCNQCKGKSLRDTEELWEVLKCAARIKAWTNGEKGSVPKSGRHSATCFSTRCICAVAAWWFNNPHQKVVPGSRIPRGTSHFSRGVRAEMWKSRPDRRSERPPAPEIGAPPGGLGRIVQGNNMRWDEMKLYDVI